MAGPGDSLLMLSRPEGLLDHRTEPQRGGGVVKQTAGNNGVHLQGISGAGP